MSGMPSRSIRPGIGRNWIFVEHTDDLGHGSSALAHGCGERPPPASIQGGTPRILRLVPGAITAVQINGSVAVLTGSADVTGLGAGTSLPFTATAERGGPGTRFVLTISGLTFNEAILEGEMSF